MNQAPLHRLRRFFCPDLTGPEVVLSDEEAHHALHVLRLSAGAEVSLFDGRGNSAVGRITRAGPRGVVAAVQRRPPAAQRPGAIVRLAFAVPKGKRLDWLLEKATELAAASLCPVAFHRSIAGGEQLTPAKRRRWLTHCVAAAKQSGTDFLPDIEPLMPLTRFLKVTQRTGSLLIRN